MKKVIMLRGLPASGKSTYAKNLVKNNPGQYKRINKDELRAMLDASHHSKGNEEFVLKVRDWLIVEALKEGKHVIVDDTNLSSKHHSRICQLVGGYCKETEQEVRVEIKFFDIPLEECIKRDLARSNSVGEKVIKKMYHQFICNIDDRHPEYTEQDPALPLAVICDIDGTLALMGDRSPYDGSKCMLDLPNHPVIDIIQQYNKLGCRIIIFSGREDIYFEQTIDWLNSYGIPYSCVIMRKAGDIRKDSIIKKEMFDAYVRNKYYVKFVLDDRDQVVEMWRKELRLPCLQVNYGDF